MAVYMPLPLVQQTEQNKINRLETAIPMISEGCHAMMHTILMMWTSAQLPSSHAPKSTSEILCIHVLWIIFGIFTSCMAHDLPHTAR
jgi:hypothetical protein